MSPSRMPAAGALELKDHMPHSHEQARLGYVATGLGKSMIDDTGERDIRRAIVEVYAALAQLGMNSGSAGNISVRFGRGMLITPTGCSADSLRPRNVVSTKFDGSSVGGLEPSSEWSMHAEVYLRVAGANAVIHTHADNCVAMACLRRPIPAFHYMINRFGGDSVPCVEYSTFGTSELGAAAGAALEERTACLLANHGMLSRGNTLREAFDAAIVLETLARQYLLTLSAGQPVLLTRRNMAAVAKRFREYSHASRPRARDRWAVPRR